jgi:thiamine transport system ATP-binding protein
MTAPRLATLELAIGHGSQTLATGIELAVDRAEILAILGASGSGKSTLLSTLAGVIPAMAGSVIVDGVDVTRTPIHRRGIGMIFQEPLLFTHLNVVDNVAYGLRRHGVTRLDARSRASELLSWLGLSGYERRPIDQLSGGQAQRVALARALAPAPSVLLLDEPFSALDQDLRQRLAADVSAMLRQEGVAAIHVTHDAGEAASIADRVVTMASLSQ